MKQRFQKKLNTFRKSVKSNRGSGILTTIVCMIFLFSIVSSLLLLTYTGFTMKVSQRIGNQITQDATTAMDEIRIGLQNVVSDCIKNSYSDILKTYSIDPLNAQQKFAEKYVEALEKYVITYTTDQNEVKSENLFNDVTKTCNAAALETMIDTSSNSDVHMGNNSSNLITYTKNTSEGKLVLHNIIVTAKNGKNISKVIADISIGIPDIGEQLNRFTMSGVPEFSIIAKNNVKHISNDPAVIQGCLYGGNITMDCNSYLKLSGDTVVVGGIDSTGNRTGGLVDIKGVCDDTTPRFSTSDTTMIWSNTMKVHLNSWAKLSGNTLMANDLDLAGTNAKATLAGKYSGFGYSDSIASKSSAIVANGKNTTLDLTDLTELTLSGLAFIYDKNDETTGYQRTDAMMGESITSRENQRLYLVPVEHLRYQQKLDGNHASGDYKSLNTNPEVYASRDGYSRVEVTLKPNVKLWGDKTYEYYGASVVTMGMPFGSQSVGYYFLKFSDANKRTAVENANEYFKDYFQAHPETVKQYLTDYITAIGSSVTTKTAGNVVLNGYDDADNLTYEIREALNAQSASTISVEYALYSTMYRSVCSTLTYNKADNKTPYDYYIDDAKVKGHTFGDLVYPEGTNGTVLVCNGNVTLDNTIPSSVVIIICSGDVTVKRNFEGTIFSGNEVILNGDGDINTVTTLNSSEAGFVEAYNSLPNSDNDTDGVRDYFLNDPTQATNWKNAGENSAVTDLVKYEKWVKA